MFIGVVDGDGYIITTQTTKGYISCQLVIRLTISDAPMLREMQNVLKIGRVITYPNSNTAVLIIGRVDLQEVFFPLIQYHNLFFLTYRGRQQYERAMSIIEQNITRFTDIPLTAPQLSPLPTSAQGYVSLL